MPARNKNNVQTITERQTLDPAQAYQQARDLIAMPEDPKTKIVGEKHSMFPHLNKKMGDRINAIAALRLNGFWDAEIASLLDIQQDACWRCDKRYPNEMAKAEAAALKAAQHKMEVNIWRVRASAARYAEQMLGVLTGIALSKDPEIKPHTRRQCAVDVLNMIGSAKPRVQGGSERDVRKSTVVAIQNIIEKEPSDDNTTLEAEDAEYEDV